MLQSDTIFLLFSALTLLQFTSSVSDQHFCSLLTNNTPECDSFWLLNKTNSFETPLWTDLQRFKDNPQVIKSQTVAFNGGKPWYASVPLLPVVFATSPTLPEGKCKRQAERYLQDLQQGTLWATRMFDSSTKYPEGIISGHTRHYGNFDECYGLKARLPKLSGQSAAENEIIHGRYCLVNVEYYRLNDSSRHMRPYTLEFHPTDSAWEAIKETGDFRRIKRYKLELALCVPDACSASDVQKALEQPLEKIGAQYDLLIKTGVKGQCQAESDTPEISTAAKFYCYAMLGLVALVVVSTWYDSIIQSDEDNGPLAVDLLLCFSARRNLKSITAISHHHPGLDAIHLIRSLFICFAVAGHRWVQNYTNPIINAEYLEWTYLLPASVIVYNGPIIIEAFFAFGGLLLTHSLLLELDKRKKINFFAVIINRYIRLTPSYLVIIIFIALVLPHLGSGPYWDYKINLESSSCVNNWWANLLYINNYVNTDKLCMFQSWYMAVDYHLFLLALFVIYIFWKIPRRFGYPFIIAVIFVGCAIPFYMSFFHNVAPLFKGLPHMHEVREDSYFTDHYIKTHERLASYFVGVIAGAVIYDHSLRPWRIPAPWSRMLFFILVGILSVKSQSLGQKYYDPNENPSRFETALYAGVNRPAFALAAVSIVVLLTVGDGLDFYDKLFKPQWAQPIGRLTYGVYLVHNIKQSYDIAVVRQARTFSVDTCLSALAPDLILSFLLSLALALVVEGPCRRLEKRLLSKQSTNRHSNSSRPTVNNLTQGKKIT